MKPLHSNRQTRYWYAVYTRPRFEKKISQRLSEKGIDHFLPLIKTLKQWSDRKKFVVEPAFKSYLFVFSSENEKGSVLQTDGVVKFISIGGKHVPVPEEQVQHLKMIFSQDSHAYTVSEQLAKGDQVEIISGPLCGVKGILAQKSNGAQFILNIEVLGRSVVMNVPEKLLMKI